MFRNAVIRTGILVSALGLSAQPALAQVEEGHLASQTRIINVAEELAREREAAADNNSGSVQVDVYGDGEVIIESGTPVKRTEPDTGDAVDVVPEDAVNVGPGAGAGAGAEAEAEAEISDAPQQQATEPQPKKSATQSARERIYERIRRNRTGG